LAPLYDARFRDFVRARFGLQLSGPGSPPPYVDGVVMTGDGLLAAAPPQLREQIEGRMKKVGHAQEYLGFRLHLPAAGTETPEPLLVAALAYQEKADRTGGTFIEWEHTSLVLPAALYGSGVTRQCVERIILNFETEGRVRYPNTRGVRVRLYEAREGEARPRSPPDRNALVQMIALYKCMGFAYEVDDTRIRAPASPGAGPASQPTALCQNSLIKHFDGAAAPAAVPGAA
jgi:hypothetical protein